MNNHYIFTEKTKSTVFNINNKIKIKNIILKDNKINTIKIINDLDISCDCSIFKEKNDCRHISKMKQYFKM